MIRINLLRPGAKPIARLIRFCEDDGVGRTGCDTCRLPTAQVALRGRICVRRGKHSAKGASDRTQMTANAKRFTDDLTTGRIVDANRIDGTSGHAPRFITLQTSVRCVTRLFVKNIHADQAA